MISFLNGMGSGVLAQSLAENGYRPCTLKNPEDCLPENGILECPYQVGELINGRTKLPFTRHRNDKNRWLAELWAESHSKDPCDPKSFFRFYYPRPLPAARSEGTITSINMCILNSRARNIFRFGFDRKGEIHLSPFETRVLCVYDLKKGNSYFRSILSGPSFNQSYEGSYPRLTSDRLIRCSRTSQTSAQCDRTDFTAKDHEMNPEKEIASLVYMAEDCNVLNLDIDRPLSELAQEQEQPLFDPIPKQEPNQATGSATQPGELSVTFYPSPKPASQAPIPTLDSKESFLKMNPSGAGLSQPEVPSNRQTSSVPYDGDSHEIRNCATKICP